MFRLGVPPHTHHVPTISNVYFHLAWLRLYMIQLLPLQPNAHGNKYEVARPQNQQEEKEKCKVRAVFPVGGYKTER